jgi:hypothetical protein
MGRSISLMESAAMLANNPFHMNRTGYAYFTADEKHGHELASIAERAQLMGAGPLRYHQAGHATYRPSLNRLTTPSLLFESGGTATSGFDVLHGNDDIKKAFPYIGKSARTMLHARRAGMMTTTTIHL